MANIKSSIKRIKVARRNHARNVSQRSALRTSLKQFEATLAGGDLQEAERMLKIAIKKLDKAATKGLIHKNKANRHKSRMTRKLNAAKNASA